MWVKLIDSSDHLHVTQLENPHVSDATLNPMGQIVTILSFVSLLLPLGAQTVEARRMVVERIQREADKFAELAPQIRGREMLDQTRALNLRRSLFPTTDSSPCSQATSGKSGESNS